MSDMTEELTEVPEPVQESVQEPAAATEAPKPAGKKRGRKPKSATPPLPPPPPVEVHKPRKRRTASIAVAKMSKGERAIAAAVSAAQIERVKCIAECAKVMQMQGARESTLKSVDWQIAMLTGAPIPGNGNTQAPASNYPHYYAQTPQPPAYPAPSAPAYMPPGMRTPTLPVVPQAMGGAIDTGLGEDNDDPDQFLKVGGIVGGGGFV